jgi:outer membrane protein assembly factor BamB
MSVRGTKGLRWWPVWGIALLTVGLLVYVWAAMEGIRQDRVMASLAIGFLALLLLALWFLLFSRAPWRARLLGLGALALLVFLLTRTVEIRGVTGDLLPILGWKWSGGDTVPLTVESALLPVLEGSPSDSPQFLGRDRNGKISGVQLARDWETEAPREVWRKPVGDGWASFAVWGNLAVTQEQHDSAEVVVAYDLATGDVRWAHADETRFAATIGGIGPRATPTIDGSRVYTLGATGILNALDLQTGKRLWSQDIVERYGADTPEWGKSCSPLLIDGLVVVSAGGEDGESLVAFDSATGEEVWTAGDDKSSYSSPLVATLADVRQIVIFNWSSVAGHDPADGRLLWSHPWPYEQPNVAQPLVLPGDRLLVSSGYGVGAKMLRIEARPDGELEASVVWESPRLKAKFAHFVDFEGKIYGLDDGILVCLDPETGERCWKRGRYGHGQLLLVEDLLLLQAESGEVVLIEPNPEELTELGSFDALDGKTWNIPTLAGPYLLVRNDREAALFELPLSQG